MVWCGMASRSHSHGVICSQPSPSTPVQSSHRSGIRHGPAFLNALFSPGAKSGFGYSEVRWFSCCLKVLHFVIRVVGHIQHNSHCGSHLMGSGIPRRPADTRTPQPTPPTAEGTRDATLPPVQAPPYQSH